MPRQASSLATSNLPPRRSRTFSSRDLLLRKRGTAGRAPRNDARATRRDNLVRFVHPCRVPQRLGAGSLKHGSVVAGAEVHASPRLPYLIYALYALVNIAYALSR